ncbi:MAG: PRD domain-containing protein [Thomasclavelia sp.]|nr:PRD domain-containing protein [Thomasclavelia sp.]
MTVNYETEKQQIQFDNNKSIIIDIIQNEIKKEDYFMNHTKLNNLAIHLTIATLRIKSNNYIPMSTRQIESIASEDAYSLAANICHEVGKALNITFPDSEIVFVTVYLTKDNVLDVEFNSGLDLLDEDIFILLRKVFHEIKEEYQTDFTKDTSLYVAIGLHLAPAIDRLKNDNQLDNPLLDKIKTRHPDEFNYARVLNENIKAIYKKEFTDGELAYFVLHFVVSVHKNKGNNV